MSKTEYTLKQYYDMVCNLYVLEFLRKHEFWDKEDNTPFYTTERKTHWSLLVI